MPQPIDPQSELGRVAAAERVQQMMERAAQLAQLRQRDDAADDTVRQQEQTHQPEQKQEKVDQELQRRNPYVGLRKKKKKDDEREETPRGHSGYNARQKPEDADDPENHDLDITL
ncbi:MAG: hypothetical protein GC168_01655 [Candidatus Hydrogenedens sp.]|nr:hypothetical protein [Candidatus Hydrogenedens sp.]